MTRVSLHPHHSLHSILATQGVSKKGSVPVPTILPMWLHIQEANLMREAKAAAEAIAAVVEEAAAVQLDEGVPPADGVALGESHACMDTLPPSTVVTSSLSAATASLEACMTESSTGRGT